MKYFIFLSLLFSTSSFAIELYLNGVKYDIKGYEISNNGQTIRINHPSLPQHNSRHQVTKKYKPKSHVIRKPASYKKPIHNKTDNSVFGKLLREINSIPIGTNRSKRNYQ